MHLADPVFPPLLTGHAIKAPLTPFDEACRLASSAEIGAADCLWARNTARATWAVVLEPDVQLETAIQMGPLFQTALMDALGVLAPAQAAVQLRWPNTILLNGAKVGETRFAAAPCDPGAVPAWLVLGYDVAMQRDLKGREPGEDEAQTSFNDEGGGDLDRTRVLESVAAHFLTWLDLWTDDGFRAAHEQWIGRVEGYGKAVAISHMGRSLHGQVLGLDDRMTLMVKPADTAPIALALLETIDRPASSHAKAGA